MSPSNHCGTRGRNRLLKDIRADFATALDVLFDKLDEDVRPYLNYPPELLTASPTCRICAQHGLHVNPATVDFRALYTGERYPAGTLVCQSHHVLPITHPYWALVDAPVTAELLYGWVTEFEQWLAKGRPEGISKDDWEHYLDMPVWWREEVAVADARDLTIMRNTILDFLLQARGITPHNNQQVFETTASGPRQPLRTEKWTLTAL